MPHEAHRGLVHHLVQDHQVVVLQLLVRALEVIVEELDKFAVLLREVGEVDEEPTAHVPLHRLHLLRPGRAVALDQKVAVLEEAAPTDLLGVLSGDQLFVKMVKRLLEVPVHALTQHRRVEVVRDGHAGAVVEEEEGVEHDVK